MGFDSSTFRFVIYRVARLLSAKQHGVSSTLTGDFMGG